MADTDTTLSGAAPAGGPEPTRRTDPTPTRLVRPQEGRVIAGVAAGIARHLGVDPVLIRIAFVVAAFAGGSGLLAYVVAWIVIPEASPGEVDDRPVPTDTARTTRVVAGVALIIVGAFWLVEQLVPDLAGYVWPVGLIVLGLAVVVAGVRR